MLWFILALVVVAIVVVVVLHYRHKANLVALGNRLDQVVISEVKTVIAEVKKLLGK